MKKKMFSLLMAALLAPAMTVTAFAREGEFGSDPDHVGVFGGTGMSSILDSLDTIVSLMGKVWDVMTSNPLLTLFVAVSLLMAGIKVFKRIKAAAK